MDVTVPYDRDLERDLLGVCLIWPDRIGDVERIVSAEDFFAPQHAATFAAIVELWRRGEPVGPRTVSAQLRGDGIADTEFAAVMAHTPPPEFAERYAAMVVEHHARRRLIAFAGELMASARDDMDLGQVIDKHITAIDTVNLPGGQLPKSFRRLDDILDEGVEHAQWVVPGLFRSDWRVIVVGVPGSGKSQVLQSIGIAAAQGRHPFVPTVRTTPRRVLFVDLENPRERLVDGGNLVRNALRGAGPIDWDRDRTYVWEEPNGIDIRTRADHGRFESILTEFRPELVCLGPMYKLTVRRPNESWDELAITTMGALDKLRGRYKFALLMEDHGTHNELRPFGSSMWCRWPELGFALSVNEKDHSARDIGRFRLDRVKHGWPQRLDRGTSFPFIGHWENGIPASIEDAGERTEPPPRLWTASERRDPLEDFPPEPRKDLE